MKETFLRIERVTTNASMLFACAMLASAAGLGVFQILTRFVFERPAEWTEVLIRFTLIWMVFMGIPMAFRQGAMVSVDVLYRWAKPGMKRGLDVSGHDREFVAHRNHHRGRLGLRATRSGANDHRAGSVFNVLGLHRDADGRAVRGDGNHRQFLRPRGA